jgi:hypothetical protein
VELSFVGVEPSPLLLRQFIGLLYQRWVIDGDDCETVSGRNEWQEKLKYSEETCPSAALATADRTHDLARTRTPVAAVGSRRLAV